MGRLDSLLVARLESELATTVDGGADLNDALAKTLEQCHTSWPNIERDDESFVGYLAERLAWLPELGRSHEPAADLSESSGSLETR